MNYVIHKNPDVIDVLKENFVEDGGYTKEIAASEIKNLMLNYPDRVCVVVAYDGDKILGHLVGYLVWDRDYVYLEQAYSVADADIAKQGFDVFRQWAKSMGAKTIRQENERKSVADCSCRRYGFKEHGIVMELKL